MKPCKETEKLKIKNKKNEPTIDSTLMRGKQHERVLSIPVQININKPYEYSAIILFLIKTLRILVYFGPL